MLIGNRPSSATGKKPEEQLLYEFAPIGADGDDQTDLWDTYCHHCYSQNPPIPALSVMKPILSGTKFSAKLAHYKIGKNLPIILQLLSQVKNISVINLSDNTLEPSCIPQLLEFVINSDSLSMLNIADNPLMRSKAVKDLLEGIGENRSLETLDISNTGCSQIGSSIAKLIQNCTVLLRLDAVNCDLRHTAIDIANALPNSEKLKRLNLKKNQLHVGGKRFATLLGSCAARCTSLRKLYLSENAITDEMAAVLLRGLSDSPVLTVLDISNNMIGEPSGRALSAFVSKSTSLKALDISQNPILNVSINKVRGSEANPNADNKEANKKDKKQREYVPGVYLLLNALAKNTSLITLSMYGLVADEDEIRGKITQLSSQNSQITVVYRGPESRYFGGSSAPEAPRFDSSDDDVADDED